jgi:trimethylamine--corrinoid protein Co-methyltransferase
MHSVGNTYSLMTNNEVELIYQSAIHILEKMGMNIENNFLLDRLYAAGLPVDISSHRVRFPKNWIENWLNKIEKTDEKKSKTKITSTAGIYFSKYHDPITNTLQSWTEERLAFYSNLAKNLTNIGNAVLLGNRLDCPPSLEPVYERYYSWKYGIIEGGSIYLDNLCQPLFELYQIAAFYKQQPIEDIFKATVYVIPALKLGRHEASQIAFFIEHGLRVGIGGSLFSMGANAPVTLAGVVTLNLAEQLALNILNYVFFDDRHFWINSSIAPLDMRTLIRPFGRPEMALANLMTAQIARYLGANFTGHAGLTDAKLPSVEAGYQKAFSALPTLMVGGNLWIDAGLLAIDEVCSPIQMVLDNEFISALNHFSKDYPIDEETIGLELIIRSGPGGGYAAEEHTAQHFRQHLWQPKIWSREMLNVWQENGCKLDIDKAREFALSIKPIESQMNEDFERDILKLLSTIK